MSPTVGAARYRDPMTKAYHSYGGLAMIFESEEPRSLYTKTAVRSADPSDPDEIPPGTSLTASVETIDNDVAALMVDAGVVR